VVMFDYGQFTGFQLMAPSAPRSSPFRESISSSSSSKSYNCAFEAMRDGLADFGSGEKLSMKIVIS
jgi:hypothetical protein